MKGAIRTLVGRRFPILLPLTFAVVAVVLPGTAEGVGLSWCNIIRNLEPGSQEVVRINFGGSFWPQPGGYYVVTADVDIDNTKNPIPFTEDDLFFSFAPPDPSDPGARTYHLEWKGIFIPQGQTRHAVAFPFSLYVSDPRLAPSPPDYKLRVIFRVGQQSTGIIVYPTFTVNFPPVADAGPDQTVECPVVTLDGSASSDPDGDTLSYEWSVPENPDVLIDDPTSATPTGMFPVGETTVLLTVTDGKGGVDVDDVVITVVADEEPPIISCLTDRLCLWPPNHQIVEVTLFVWATDECVCPDFLDVTALCTSSEPDDATGDGSFTGDVNGEDGYQLPQPVTLSYDGELECYVGTLHLRAERDGSEAGRVYSILCNGVDLFGNSSTADCAVVVPHDRRKK